MSASEIRHHRWATWSSGVAFVLSIAAFAWPTWLEPWLGDGADGGDGSIEYALAAGFALAAIALLVWPYLAKRRATATVRAGVRHGD